MKKRVSIWMKGGVKNVRMLFDHRVDRQENKNIFLY